MAFPPYVQELINEIHVITKEPGMWETVRRALYTYKRLAKADKEGWRFYAFRRDGNGGQISSVYQWSFSKWLVEEEVEAIKDDRPSIPPER